MTATDPVMSQPRTILFLCTANSARSIIAEAIMNKEGAGRFRAFSAGSLPHGEINPHVIPVIESLGFTASDFRSKSWDEFARPGAPHLDFVVTVCDNAAGEVCPIWPGRPIAAHWGVPDPAAVTGADADIAAAFTETARQLGARIRQFLSLPVAELDAMRLKQSMDAIGRGETA